MEIASSGSNTPECPANYCYSRYFVIIVIIIISLIILIILIVLIILIIKNTRCSELAR